MARFNKHPDDEVIRREQKTNAGMYISAGEIEHSDYDSKDWQKLQQDYYDMRNGDAVISKTLNMIINKLAQAEFRIEGRNKKVNEYVEWSLNRINGGFTKMVRHLLLALPFGLSMAEKIVKKADKYEKKLTNSLIKLNFFQNETIYKFFYDESAIFQGIEHEKRIPEKASEFIPIDKEDLHWFTFNEEYGDVRGNAILRPLRKAWDLKQKIMFAMGMSATRGAGIVKLETKGQPSSSDKSTIEQIGRTLGQAKSTFVAYDIDKMEVKLEELKNQDQNKDYLEFLNREIFFGMMSEFSTSGIGQNGSRAATGEHKSTFEMALNYILQLLEKNIQELIDYIISISLFADIKEDEKPEFRFNSLTQIDLLEMSQIYRNMYETMLIAKQPETDETFFRETFGLPEFKKPKKEQTQETQPQMPVEAKKLSRELTKYELEIFELDSANEAYLNTQDKTQKILDKYVKIVLNDIAEQYERKGKFFIKNKDQEMLISELTGVYQNIFNLGENDVEKELNKLEPKSKALALPRKDKKKVSNSIDRFVKRLFFNMKTVLEDSLDKVTEGTLKRVGGVKAYVLGFETGFKTDKRTILSSVEDGYTDGRGRALDDNKENIELFFYSATLDKNLCDNCAPLDAQELTLEEVRENELRIGNGRVNPNCLGNRGQWCRCQLVPIKLKGE